MSLLLTLNGFIHCIVDKYCPVVAIAKFEELSWFFVRSFLAVKYFTQSCKQE